jgi:integrase
MRIDQITEDDIRGTAVGSSSANTNNALRTLRRMLKQAHKWKQIAEVPLVKLVEEEPREQELEPWMEEKLLAVTEIPRTPENKFAPKSANYGWQPFRTVLVIILDTGMRPCEIFRMRREHIKWDRGAIFVPRSKSRKSRRFVGLTQRVRLALAAQLEEHDSLFVFPSRQSVSGHIESVGKQFNLAKKLAGIPDSIVLYCGRHRFSTDAMAGTGNLMAVMDAMGHSRMDMTRIYQHPGLRQVTEAIEKRNKSVQ